MAAVIVRFAPSPTGHLHVGNVRTALLNWLYARKAGGRFLLRFDDTDRERSRESYVEAIRADLDWLGLGWDGEFRQSARTVLYDRAAERLRAAGRLYACYETPEELEFKRKMQLARHQPPIYDRGALRLDAAEKEALEAAGRRPHWRFKLDTAAPVAWHDLVRGPSHFDMSSLSDPVLVREDGSYLYMLPSVVDDIDMGITHVIRGEDHVTNSAVQMQLFAALGAAAPALAHVALLADAEGEGLSKRLGSRGVAYFREAGVEPLAVLSVLARLGTSDPVEPRASHQALIDGFDLGRFGRATAKFDEAEVMAVNARILHQLDYQAVAARLPGVSEPLWNAVRPNLGVLREAAEWRAVVEGVIAPVITDAELTQAAAEILPPEPWDERVWQRWTADVKAATGKKGRALFLPLRLALTGRDHGPELANLLPLMGRERARRRLLGEAA
ncbi:MAG: glutamate--tRNA ligase [Alphaproteobacteria bacterium]|nr:MAG: glutamate--tRNA ligase [Alphaproteobacteria bacterium]